MEGAVAFLPIHCLVCTRLLIQESRVRNKKSFNNVNRIHLYYKIYNLTLLLSETFMSTQDKASFFKTSKRLQIK